MSDPHRASRDGGRVRRTQDPYVSATVRYGRECGEDEGGLRGGRPLCQGVGGCPAGGEERRCWHFHAQAPCRGVCGDTRSPIRIGHASRRAPNEHLAPSRLQTRAAIRNAQIRDRLPHRVTTSPGRLVALACRAVLCCCAW